MKTADNLYKIGRTFMLLGFGFLLMCFAADSNSDNVQPTSRLQSDRRIRISVEEIKLDAVVLDKSGLQVANLKADDFEVYQDKKKQQVTSCTYITCIHAQPDVRRRIVFHVVDRFMNLTQVRRVQQFLKKFVEDEMQDGDFVSITRNWREDDSQVFSSDRQFLLSAIIKLQLKIDPWVMGNTSFKMLRDMPGRKVLIAISAEPMAFLSHLTSSSAVSRKFLDLAYVDSADAAFRAGVVIHILDISEPKGLDTSEPGFTAEYGSSPSIEQKMALEASARRRGRRQTPLANMTGGLLFTDSDLSDKTVKSIREQLKGYYILSYTPPADTFTPPPELDMRKLLYHRINVKVRRPGNKVHTRDGFFAAPERESASTGATAKLR